MPFRADFPFHFYPIQDLRMAKWLFGMRLETDKSIVGVVDGDNLIISTYTIYLSHIGWAAEHVSRPDEFPLNCVSWEIQ